MNMIQEMRFVHLLNICYTDNYGGDSVANPM